MSAHHLIENHFRSWDAAQLFYRAWLPDGSAKRAVLLFHRGHEHSARWQETVDTLAMPDTAIFAWDQRGHGRSPGERGAAPSVSALAKDADRFARHITQAHGIAMENMAVVAASLGAVIAVAWVHDFGPPIRGMVLAAPAFRIKLYVPLAIPGLRVLQAMRPSAQVKSYVKSKVLTHDSAQAAAYDADPLIFRQISVKLLLDLHNTATRLIKDAGAIQTPTLLLIAGKDWVVKYSAQRRFFERLGSPMKRMEVFADAYHSLFHESQRELIVDHTRAFLDECFDRPCDRDALVRADRSGFTRTEYDQLRAPGARHWPIIRANLKTFGKLSKGIGLGWKSGFDSGITLDYIYENKPAGKTPIGKAIDRFYLNAIGWRGIRARRVNLQRMLNTAIDCIARSGRPIHILDIASGPGRYVLETMHSRGDMPISALLRDYQQPNLDAARALAGQLHLSNVAFSQADAFDRNDLASISPQPTIAIASGIYELFPDNEPVLRSLSGIADSMSDGGLLIYTCQPWHPQVEFIARSLINREGKPWIMRRRTQAEMDALVRSAGFEKLEQDIDLWGIFTVSLARRTPR